MDKIKVFVADDEPQPLASLVAKVNDSHTMEVVGKGTDVSDSFDFILNNEIDVLFLDIKLIEGDAFTLIRKLRYSKNEMPPVILFTGFEEFDDAQQSINEFKDCVVLLLKKPFWSHWDQKEEDIIREVRKYQMEHRVVAQRITVRTQNTSYALSINDIISVSTDDSQKSSGKIIVFSLKNGPLILFDSLTSFEKRLDNNFLRISKYAIINKSKIERYEHISKNLYLEELTAPFKVGEKYEQSLLDYLK